MEYIKAYWDSLAGLTIEMAPYLLFGFLFAGILKVFFPQKLLMRYMGKSNAWSSLNASLLGIPMPLCSCGVLPTGISLFRNGASRGSTNSFLISTPQTGVDSILVTYSMLGLPFAIIRPLVALVTGFSGGVLTNWLVKDKKTRDHLDEGVESKPKKSLAYMFRYAYVEFLQDISQWLIIGLLMAALIAVLIPDNFFTEHITNDWAGMFLILIASIPLYVCATASVPIAAVLLMKGLPPGAILVFLMAGPATNIATITVLMKTLGRQTTLIYLGTIVFGAMAFGYLINQLPREWFAPLMTGGDHHHEILPKWLSIGSAVTLVVLVINGYLQKYIFTQKTEDMQDANAAGMLVKVTGMDCNHCKNSVELNLKKIDNIDNVIADLKSQTVQIEGKDVDMEKVKETVESLGYHYEGRV